MVEAKGAAPSMEEGDSRQQNESQRSRLPSNGLQLPPSQGPMGQPARQTVSAIRIISSAKANGVLLGEIRCN